MVLYGYDLNSKTTSTIESSKTPFASVYYNGNIQWADSFGRIYIGNGGPTQLTAPDADALCATFMKYDSNGNLYVGYAGENGNSTCNELDPTEGVNGALYYCPKGDFNRCYPGPIATMGASFPNSIAADNSGNVLVTWTDFEDRTMEVDKYTDGIHLGEIYNDQLTSNSTFKRTCSYNVDTNIFAYSLIAYDSFINAFILTYPKENNLLTIDINGNLISNSIPRLPISNTEQPICNLVVGTHGEIYLGQAGDYWYYTPY